MRFVHDALSMLQLRMKRTDACRHLEHIFVYGGLDCTIRQAKASKEAKGSRCHFGHAIARGQIALDLTMFCVFVAV